jgi:hypothetical protein
MFSRARSLSPYAFVDVDLLKDTADHLLFAGALATSPLRWETP